MNEQSPVFRYSRKCSDPNCDCRWAGTEDESNCWACGKKGVGLYQIPSKVAS